MLSTAAWALLTEFCASLTAAWAFSWSDFATVTVSFSLVDAAWTLPLLVLAKIVAVNAGTAKLVYFNPFIFSPPINITSLF